MESFKKHPDIKVKVVGYTCSEGPAVVNAMLSTERTVSTLEYLRAKEIPQKNINLTSHRDALPYFDNSTAESRAANRRVDLLHEMPVK